MNASNHFDELESCRSIHLSNRFAITQQNQLRLTQCTKCSRCILIAENLLMVIFTLLLRNIENKPFSYRLVCRKAFKCKLNCKVHRLKVEHIAFDSFCLFHKLTNYGRKIEHFDHYGHMLTTKLSLSSWRTPRAHTHKKSDGVHYVLTLSGGACVATDNQY